MKQTIKLLNILGLIILFSIAFLPIFGEDTFGFYVTYGSGLGDLFFVLFSLLIFIIGIFLTSHKFVKLKWSIITSIVIYLTITYLIYSFTVGRGSEFPWNGEIFIYK